MVFSFPNSATLGCGYAVTWCSSALCPLSKGHSGFPTSCSPTILNAQVHFIRSRMPRSCTHLKCRWENNNSGFSSFSLILAEGSLWASGCPAQGLGETWSIWVWPEDSHIRQRQFLRAFSPLKIDLSFFTKKPQSNFTVVGHKQDARRVLVPWWHAPCFGSHSRTPKPPFLTFPHPALLNQTAPETHLEKENPLSRLNVGGRKASWSPHSE